MQRPPPMFGGDKHEIRRQARARRAAIALEKRAAFAERLALKGVEVARCAVARYVGVYWPLKHEADTTYLAQALAYHEFTVGLPAAFEPRLPLSFRAWTPRDRLVPGRFGVLEPSARAREIYPDVLFTPLVAFDRRGHRLGYGAGYYDATLRALRVMKPLLAVGVAFAAQEAESIPAEAHDERLDLILTEDGLIDCRAD